MYAGLWSPGQDQAVLEPDPASSPKPPLLPGKLDRGASHKGTTSALGAKEKQETPRHSSMGQAAGTDPAALRHSKAKELDWDLAPSPITNSCKALWGLARPLSLSMMSSLNTANFLQGFGFPSELSYLFPDIWYSSHLFHVTNNALPIFLS